MKTRGRVAAAVVVLATAASASADLRGADHALAAGSECGTKELYGVRYPVRISGEAVPCRKVRQIVKGRCNDGRVWSCFSFHPPAPILVWFRTDERFEEEWSTVIEAVRYPCREAGFTRAEWERDGGDFPTRQQVLADDLLRCRRLLDGTVPKDARTLLGPPDAKSRDRDQIYLDYGIGPERDSFFQVDSEYLSLKFSRKGGFRSASIYQG